MSEEEITRIGCQRKALKPTTYSLTQRFVAKNGKIRTQVGGWFVAYLLYHVGHHYLYFHFTSSCKKRYPERGSSCPDNQSAVSPEAEDEAWFANPYPLANYYFPDFNKNSCVSVMIVVILWCRHIISCHIQPVSLYFADAFVLYFFNIPLLHAGFW